MILVLDGVLLLLLVAFMAVGVRRGPWPEVVALGGLLLGALLADEWGRVWGSDLAAGVGFLGADAAQLIVRMLLFLVPLAVVGYGGALLLPRQGRPATRARGVAALLALFNGLAILAVVLRNWYDSQISSGRSGSALTDDPVTRFFLEWAGWWPLLLALGGMVAVIGAVVRLRQSVRPAKPASVKPLPVPAANPASAAGAGAALPPASSTPVSISGAAYPPPLTPASNSAPASPPALADQRAAQPMPVRPAGSAVTEDRRCRTCSKVLAPGAAFCPNCGTPV